MNNEELNKIIDKAENDYEAMKDKIHELYEENENLKKREEIIYKGYMSVVDELTEYANENKKLKENIEWWKDRFFGQQEYDDSHRITAIEYKKRIDKAIEELKQAYTDIRNNDNANYIHIAFRNDLLNILQNGDE